MYWNQLNHAGIVSLLAKRPPNKSIGIIITGATAIAVISFSKADDTKYPIEAAAYTCNSRVSKKHKNYTDVISKPTEKYMIRALRIGFRTKTGVSMIIFEVKYGPTSYILLACSLRNTGRSRWNTRIVFIRLPMKRLVAVKKHRAK